MADADRNVADCVVNTLKRCVKGALSNDAGKVEVLRNVVLKSTKVVRNIAVSRNEAGSLKFVVCMGTLRSLSDGRFF